MSDRTKRWLKWALPGALCGASVPALYVLVVSRSLAWALITWIIMSATGLLFFSDMR